MPNKKSRAKRSPPVRTSKEEIISTAQSLFLEKGYHGTSTANVCESLGISRPTLYWYFQNKEELLFEASKQSLNGHVLPVIEKATRIKDPKERLVVFIEEYTKIICTDSGAKVQIKETEYLDEEHREWVMEIWRKQFHLVRSTIEELQKSGQAKPLPATFAAFSLLGMITWCYTWFDLSRPESIAPLVKTINELFFSGLLAGEGPSPT